MLETTRNAYPSFDVPFHSRWRHFSVNGDDRWAAVADCPDWPDRAALARAEFDLAIVSVFLDAGAGPSGATSMEDRISYRSLGRIGACELRHVHGWRFLGGSTEPLRVDADMLANLDVADLARGMQVTDDNPLVGLDGRADLLRRLGRLVASKPDIFGSHDTPRPGGLYDRLASWPMEESFQADDSDGASHHLGPIWPADHARRRRSGRHLATSGARNRRCDQRLGAVA